MEYNRQQVERAKAQGHYALAGWIAFKAGCASDSYGCHFGMRSDLLQAKESYARGWRAAHVADDYAKRGEALYAGN